MADAPAKIILGDTAIAAIERRPQKRSGLSHCENCGAPLHGHWCSQCGQPAVHYRRSFRHVIVDILDSFFNWDSKFFATMAWLIVRPWHLTNEFLRGRRVRQLHPLRLYLLASVLFFFAVNYWAKSLHLNARQLSAAERSAIEAELKNENLPPEARAKIEEALRLRNTTSAPTAQPAEKQSPESKENLDQREGPLVQFGPETPSTPFERWIEARAKQKLGEHGTNAELFLKALFSNLPYMMLCCIPLFAFVLKILYSRRHIFYIDHLIYALHIHSFAYFGAMLIGLATIGLNRVHGALAGWGVAVLWFAFAAQILFSIRYVYQQSWLITLLKFFLGSVAYLIVLTTALAVTFLVTLALPG